MSGKNREAGLELYAPGTLKDSPYWYVRGTHCGVKVFRSTKSHRKPPRSYLRKLEREIEDELAGEAAGRQPDGGEAPTFTDAVLAYEKICPDSELRYVRILLNHFGATPLEDISSNEIREAAEELYPDAANSTRNRNVVTPASAILHEAHEKNLCEWKRIKRFKEGKPKRRHATPEVAAQLIEALAPRRWLCPPRIRGTKEGRWVYPRACGIFLFATGARITEAVSLDFDEDDVDFEHRAAMLRDTKNDETYEVALHDVAYAAIAGLPHRSGRVFGYRNRRQFLDDWRAAGDACGVETRRAKGGLTPHGTRHSFATWLRQQGKGVYDLMEMCRWKDVKSAVPYMHFGAEEHRDAVANLPLARENRVKSKGRKS